MKNKITILGSGQTAMIAAIMLANRGYNIDILDDKPLAQSHFALLRFKTKQIEEETGISCEEVEIKKAIYFDGKIHNESNIKMDNLYAKKVTSKIQKRSIGSLGVGKRYIPPMDFFDQLINKCRKLNVNFNQVANLNNFLELFLEDIQEDSTIISTLPMPKMHQLVNQLDINFDFEKVYVVEFEVPNCNVHQTIYYPTILDSTNNPAYRISVIGNNIKCEISENTMKEFWNPEEQNTQNEELPATKEFKFEKLLKNLDTQIWNSFGIEIGDHAVNDLVQNCLYNGVESTIKEQKFGKISPINEQLRQSIIYNLTKNHSIYSLGRFSCWKQILLDDVVQDVKKIENMIKIKNLSGYEASKIMASSIQL